MPFLGAGCMSRGVPFDPLHLHDEADCGSPRQSKICAPRAPSADCSAEYCSACVRHAASLTLQQADCCSRDSGCQEATGLDNGSAAACLEQEDDSSPRSSMAPCGQSDTTATVAAITFAAQQAGAPSVPGVASGSYISEYHAKYGRLPWRELLVEGCDNAPWLLHLPPAANYSLHGWGRCLFSQTPACQHGRLGVSGFDAGVEDSDGPSNRTSPAVTLAKCCAAFAYSPLSVVIDIRAAVQCISLATKSVLGTDGADDIFPSLIELQLDHVCAAGCGKSVSPGSAWYVPACGTTLRYCTKECARTHVAKVPDDARIYMCWPRQWVDSLHLQRNDTPPPYETEAYGTAPRKRSADRSRRRGKAVGSARASEAQLTTEAYTTYLRQLYGRCELWKLILVCAYIRHIVPRFTASDPIVKALRGITSSYVSGYLCEEAAYVNLIVLLYNNEHQIPGIRVYLSDILPPRPFPVLPPAPTATPSPTPPLPAPSQPTPVSHTTPATAHAPDSLCTTVQRLTEADLARISDLARNAWGDALCDRRPMLWHVRRRVYEQVCARMGLPAVGVQSQLWVASERGDAWGSLGSLEAADPAGLCLPPKLRLPYRIWGYACVLSGFLIFYAMGEYAATVLLEGFVRTRRGQPEEWSFHDFCATCGKHGESPPSLFVCPGCQLVALCSEDCHRQHEANKACELLKWRGREGSDQAILPLSFTSLPARTASTASDQQASHTSDPITHPSSPLQRDASATAGCPAAAVAPAPSRSVSAQRTHTPVGAAQDLAAEYRQCVEGNPLLQRVAAVVMPRGAEREPESAAVVAAQQLLIAASGLLDARDLEEVLAAAGA